MDKIKFSYRTGGVDLKDVCKKWEEELFSDLISNNEVYLPEDYSNFEDESFNDYMKIRHKLLALCDIGIIDASECETLSNKFLEIKNAYVKSKKKEVF